MFIFIKRAAHVKTTYHCADQRRTDLNQTGCSVIYFNTLNNHNSVLSLKKVFKVTKITDDLHAYVHFYRNLLFLTSSTKDELTHTRTHFYKTCYLPSVHEEEKLGFNHFLSNMIIYKKGGFFVSTYICPIFRPQIILHSNQTEKGKIILKMQNNDYSPLIIKWNIFRTEIAQMYNIVHKILTFKNLADNLFNKDENNSENITQN